MYIRNIWRIKDAHIFVFLCIIGAAPGRGGPGGPAGRRQPAKKKGRGDGNDDGQGRNNRRASLRIGTGRKGRGAELSRRRGSLKKRDRSAEKARRAEAATERNTVDLPEYVDGDVVWLTQDTPTYFSHIVILSS